MTRNQAIEYARNNFSGLHSDYTCIVRLRHTSACLPDIGIDGSFRDDCDWAFIDTAEKMDSGIYGAIYYFGEKE